MKVSVRMADRLVATIDRIAAEDQVSRSEVVTSLVEAGLTATGGVLVAEVPAAVVEVASCAHRHIQTSPAGIRRCKECGKVVKL